MVFSAVIAAAGCSSRMHEFKPLLCLGETTMIQSVIQNLRAAGVEEIVVVTGYKSDLLRQHVASLGVRVCENRDYASTDMFTSLRLGLAALEHPYDYVFLTPGDVPLVQPQTIRFLQASGAQLARPVNGSRGGHPLMLAADLVPDLLAYHGDGGLRGAMSALGVPLSNIAVDDAGTVLDADTPQDFKRLRQHAMQTRSGGRLWLDMQVHIAKGDTILTPERAQFLEMIGQTASIQTACSCMHMSYTKGWRLLNAMEQELGYPLVERFQGGANGGGSRLTGKGKRLLAVYQEFRSELRELAEQLFLQKFPPDLHN